MLACTDGGVTGRSLQLVSRYVNQTSRAAMFHSLSIHGLRQMLALAALLESNDLSKQNRRRVHHLSITDCQTHHFEVGGNIMREDVANIWEERSLAPVEAPWVPNDLEETRSDAIQRIINANSSSLISLSLYLAVCSRAPLKLSFYMPRLTELTTLLCIQEPQLAVSTLESFKTYPSLRRWNTAGFSVYLPYLFGHITRLAPRLTHLKLHRVQPCSESLVRALDPFYKGYEDVVRLPVTIERVFIQTDPLNSWRWDLEILRPTFSRKRGRITLHTTKDVKYDKQEAKVVNKQWQDRINGGKGCWKVSLKRGRVSV